MTALGTTRTAPPAAPGRPDLFLLGLTALLTVVGLVVLWSASFVIALVNYHNANGYVLRQMVGAVAGTIMLLAAARTDYRRLRHLALPIMVATVLALVAVLVLGSERNGAKRWLGPEIIAFQPAEFAKLAVAIFLARWLVGREEKMHSWQDSFIPFVIILGCVGALIMAEPSLGTTLVVAGIAVTMFYVAGASWAQLGALLLSGAVCVGMLIAIAPYRAERFSTFFGRTDDDAAFQTHQALVALGNGGWDGLGLGASRGKFFYIPESHTDGVFAVLGEEMGVVIAGVVLLLYVVLILRGFALARRCEDEFGAYLATGITAWIAVQMFLNVGGILSVLPLTGVPLPLMSYGNNALASMLLGIGVLVSISRNCPPAAAGPREVRTRRRNPWPRRPRS